jgi:hypothetical protein
MFDEDEDRWEGRPKKVARQKSGTLPRSVRSAYVSSNADAFRSRATQCRDVANGTEDVEAQRELRALARDLDAEADNDRQRRSAGNLTFERQKTP